MIFATGYTQDVEGFLRARKNSEKSNNHVAKMISIFLWRQQVVQQFKFIWFCIPSSKWLRTSLIRRTRSWNGRRKSPMIHMPTSQNGSVSKNASYFPQFLYWVCRNLLSSFTECIFLNCFQFSHLRFSVSIVNAIIIILASISIATIWSLVTTSLLLFPHSPCATCVVMTQRMSNKAKDNGKGKFCKRKE